MPLSVHGHPINGIFRLLGADENSATYAVGWALDRCPTFREVFLRQVTGHRCRCSDGPRVLLQHRDRDNGLTDIELKCGDSAHIIVEAKAGWTLPSARQLQRYAGRLTAERLTIASLVTVSAMPARIAKLRGLARIGPVPVTHLSWSDLRDLARTACASTRRIEEKRWLREVVLHLEEFVAMDRRTSNEVYVVSLSVQPIKRGSAYTWIDVVERDSRYFHPVGDGWPTEPPNYVGFRYGGCLRSVHHVDGVSIIKDLSSENPHWPKTRREHFVYWLGPPMTPVKQVRTGGIYRNGRVVCAIDTLLSGQYPTIAKARDATKKRLAAKRD